MSVFRRVHKTLTCPACGVVVAEAAYRPWPGNLTLTSPDGTTLQPRSGAVLLRLTSTQRANASSPGERATAEARNAFVRRNVSELIFDVHCRNGHRILQSMPQIVRAMRKAHGQWVDL